MWYNTIVSSIADLVEGKDIVDIQPCRAHIPMEKSAEQSLLERQHIRYRPQMRRPCWIYQGMSRPKHGLLGNPSS
jgi:hypothetical protein